MRIKCIIIYFIRHFRKTDRTGSAAAAITAPVTRDATSKTGRYAKICPVRITAAAAQTCPRLCAQRPQRRRPRSTPVGGKLFSAPT